jgi:hypothetical protein
MEQRGKPQTAIVNLIFFFFLKKKAILYYDYMLCTTYELAGGFFYFFLKLINVCYIPFDVFEFYFIYFLFVVGLIRGRASHRVFWECYLIFLKRLSLCFGDAVCRHFRPIPKYLRGSQNQIRVSNGG